MNRALNASLLALGLLSLACGGGGGGSSTPAAPTPTVAGTAGIWTGSYGSGAAAPASPYRMVLFADGTTRVSADAGLTSRAKGSWTLSGSTLAGTYTYLPSGPTYSTTGTVGTTTLTGTWGAGTATSGGGTYTLTREQGAALGVWVGKYDGGTGTPQYNYRFIAYADGTLDADVDSGTPWNGNATGTWTLSGSTFRGTYTYRAPLSGTFSFTGTLAGNALTGTWGGGTATSGGGTLTMAR